MKKYKISFLLCAMSLSCLSLNAQSLPGNAKMEQDSSSSDAMTQQLYRERVMNYSLMLKQAKEGSSQAMSGIKAVKSGMLPQLTGALDFNYLLKNIEFDLGGSSMKLKPANYGATVTAAQNVFAGGAVRKKMKSAEFGAEIAESNVLLTIDNVIYNADYVYWSASAVSAYMKVTEEYLGVVKETQALVKERYESGLISKNDLLLIETRVAEAELNYSQVQGQYKSAIIGVNMMMGVKPNSNFIFAGNILVNKVEPLVFADINTILTKRPEYLMAASQLNQSRQDLKVTNSDYLPQIAVGVTGQYQTQQINFNGDVLLNGVAFAQVKVPIFAGNSKKHRKAIDKSRIRASEFALNSARDQVVQEVSVSWSNLNESSKQLEIAKRNQEIASQSLDLNSFSFSQGLLSIIDLMQAQLSWFGAYNSFIQANYNYRIALTQYNKSIGEYDRF